MHSAAASGIYSKKKELEQSAAEAQQYAASLFADAHAAAYTAHNRSLNAWHVDLCGLSAADAVSTFSVQLGHIASLEYPGGVLMCVVTGPACNDTIEQTWALEQRLLTCIIEKGGVACPDVDGIGSRAGRVGSVVAAFIRVDPASRVVDAACMESAADAARAAATFQTSSKVFASAAKSVREDGNMSDAASYQAQAEQCTRDARAALLRNRSLKFAAHNSSFVNSWRIDLHGQSEETALSRVEQQLLAFRSMGHPGGITLRIITGKGKHSVNQIAVVRPAVLRYLREYTPREFECDNGQGYILRHTDKDGANDGVALVRILPKEGPAANVAAAATAGWA
jgi:DNA-nicking Smr family endonuclease